MILGGLEAGGTKMVVSIGDEHGNVLERATMPTRTPAETMPEIISFFEGKDIEALGIASFGPVQLNHQAENWGYITTTPKLPWQHFDLVGTLAQALSVPVEIDTDVNAAAMAEVRMGAAQGTSSCVYFTVGTGIGGGVVVDGKMVHGLVHPEFGHIPLRPHPEDPTPDGFCPYHTGCLEGLANGPALQQRWGMPGHELPPEHLAWDLEAYYLAQACVTAILVVSPERIVMGGGVMHQPQLLPKIHRQVLAQLGGYVQHEAILEHIDEYIVSPGLGDNAGCVGALLLSLDTLARADK